MADRIIHGRVILCWPSNREDIERLNRLTNSRSPFVPTIEHSLSTCDSCRRSIWIARQQLQLANSPFVRTTKLCMFCMSRINQALNVEIHEVDIAPEVQHARKRTT
jgi:hypothetical protein